MLVQYMITAVFTRQRHQIRCIPSSEDNFKYSYRLKQQLLHISETFTPTLLNKHPALNIVLYHCNNYKWNKRLLWYAVNRPGNSRMDLDYLDHNKSVRSELSWSLKGYLFWTSLCSMVNTDQVFIREPLAIIIRILAGLWSSYFLYKSYWLCYFPVEMPHPPAEPQL